jgi:hypothetical protein
MHKTLEALKFAVFIGAIGMLLRPGIIDKLFAALIITIAFIEHNRKITA